MSSSSSSSSSSKPVEYITADFLAITNPDDGALTHGYIYKPLSKSKSKPYDKMVTKTGLSLTDVSSNVNLINNPSPPKRILDKHRASRLLFPEDLDIRFHVASQVDYNIEARTELTKLYCKNPDSDILFWVYRQHKNKEIHQPLELPQASAYINHRFIVISSEGKELKALALVIQTSTGSTPLYNDSRRSGWIVLRGLRWF